MSEADHTAFYCYTISDKAGVVRYVGKGTSSRRHKNINRRGDAIKSLIEAGMTLPAVIVRDNITEQESFDMERELIAFHGRDCDGGTLVNKALGGPGAPGVKCSDKKRAKLRLVHLGKPKSPEQIAKRIAAITGKKASAETRAKMSKAHSNRSPETRERMGEAQRGKTMSDEARAKIAEGNRRRWAAWRAEKAAAISNYEGKSI